MNSNSTLDQAINALDELIKKSKPETSTTMKSAVVALFTADRQGELRYANCIGLLQFDIDRLFKTKVLRLYNMQTVSLVFEVELYYGFSNHYKMISETFYVFQYPMGLVGFLFKSKDDADIMKIKISSFSPKIQEFEDIKKKRMEEAKERKKQGSLFNKLKVFLSDEAEQPKQKSGQVLSFQKEKGISLNLKTGQFNTQNISPEWQQIFDSLKLKKKDLQNKQITNLIAEQTIMRQVKTQAVQDHDAHLQKRIREAEDEQRQFLDACRQSMKNNLPPPPPPPPLLLVPPQLSQNRGSFSSKRANLMDEIRNNKLKLNHVSQANNGVNLDISNMNKEERMDHAELLRQKIKQRKKALDMEGSDED